MADPKGPEIEAMRKARGWKRSELAQRVGCSYQHIYNLERGFNLVAEEVLQRIASAFNVPLSNVMQAPKPPAPRKAPTSAPKPPSPAPPPRPTKPPTRVAEGTAA
jgi:transcriptional regulator with XRE-family HTH domain